MNFLTGALTYDTLNTIAADYDSLPNVSYDSAYWIAGTRALAVFAPGGQAQTLTGPSFGASITIADIGSDAAVTHLDRFVMLFDVAPTSSSAAGQIRSASGGMAQGGSVVDLFGGVYRLRQTAKWHVLSLNFNGPTSVTGYDYSLKPAGLR